ncbi:LuxR C-terminal-related transcriptional regulator [Amycolatopsis sp. NEAU-NG30]|uniref:LuxR C-terminal-related transcriptional regulator n=1 Tax=Amycolatopsis melonis TaxID=3156488 RepID=A0ABV0L6V1_9PSEU
MGEPRTWHVASVDGNFRVMTAESGFCALFGVSGFELRHRSLLDYLHPDFAEGPRRALTALAAGDRREAAEHVVLAVPGGTAVSAELTALRGPRRIVVAVRRDVGRAQRARQTLLSPLEALVLEGLAAGVPTTELAQRAHLSRQGVEYHVGALVRRFGVPNRTALVAKAHAAGMYTADVWPPRVDPRVLETTRRAVGS